jgi:hypothetical protein
MEDAPLHHPADVKDEPGVMIYGSENRRDGKRNHVTVRIPASILEDHCKLINRQYISNRMYSF